MDRDPRQQHGAGKGVAEGNRRGVEGLGGGPFGDLVAIDAGELVRDGDGDEPHVQKPHRLARYEAQRLHQIVLVQDCGCGTREGNARMGGASRLLRLLRRLLVEAGIVDRDGCHVGEQHDDALVLVREGASGASVR